jgi:hypothetical protein
MNLTMTTLQMDLVLIVETEHLIYKILFINNRILLRAPLLINKDHLVVVIKKMKFKMDKKSINYKASLLSLVSKDLKNSKISIPTVIKTYLIKQSQLQENVIIHLMLTRKLQGRIPDNLHKRSITVLRYFLINIKECLIYIHLEIQI